MSAIEISNLLDLNVDGLFETYSINEIDQIHHKLQQSIEEKKEDLRMMVGERYRDLLQAADTIGEMRKTSTGVIEHIDGILTSYRCLNEQQLIGFKVDAKADCIDSSRSDPVAAKHMSSMAQIHLLIVLPELIWQRVDDEDYFQATQLFIFARHIYTGLQLDASLEITKTFPIAKRQWEHLNQFFFMIKRMCLKQLGRPDLSTDLVVKCLTSLALLDNCQIDKLLALFFQLRTRAYQDMLNTADDSFKVRILNSLRLLNETIWQVYKCFADTAAGSSGKCLLIDELEVIGGGDARPVIAMIPLDESPLYKSLPPLIANFKPQIQLQPMAPDAIQRSLDSWIQAISSDSVDLLRQVFDSIGSVRTIHNINKAAMELEKPDNWKETLHQLHLNNGTDFYELFYQPLTEDRIKTIIRVSWTDAIEKSVTNISELLGTDAIVTASEKTFWTDDTEDNPSHLDRDARSHVLLMKTKGYNSSICRICADLDNSIKSIYDDLSLYVNSTVEDSIDLHDDPKKREKHASLIGFLRESSQNAINDFIVRVKALTARDDVQSESIVFLAKLLKALTEICPTVKQCLMPTSLLLSNTWTDTNVSSIEHWEQICRQINDQSLNLWQQWLQSFLNECLYTPDGLCFPVDITLTTTLDLFPNWETYAIEEKDESNETVQSLIRVPAHPSVPLQRFLFDCCTRLNRRIPETLPKAVTQILNANLLEHILATYKALNENNEFVANNQNASLQLYFDVKFVVVLLSSGTQNERFQEIAAKFKASIDPFDFELFHKYINANVKLAAQRLLHQYGLLIPAMSSGHAFLATAVKQVKITGSHDKDPNLLPLANGGVAHTNWFTMLPIPDDLKHSKIVEAKSDKVKSPAKGSSPAPVQSTAQQNLSNVKSNAAAFFGAMSQDWFR